MHRSAVSTRDILRRIDSVVYDVSWDVALRSRFGAVVLRERTPFGNRSILWGITLR
jgi:hypothetical protein